jgi:ribosomal protein S18 acetylase RimI-like enzyme
VRTLEEFHRFWRSLDEVAGQVRETWWGAVVTQPRCPDVWDANYARVDADTEVRAGDVEADLLPALAAAGAGTEHVVTFHPGAHGDLLSELSTRGHRIAWDLVMAHEGQAGPVVDVTVDELEPGDDLWRGVRASLGLFGVEPPAVLDQLLLLERDILAPRVKRWFAVRADRGQILSIAALVTMDHVSYLDNVATFPDARGRGLASTLVARLVDEAHAVGARHVFLIADPHDAAVVRMYERLGFRSAGQLASTRWPLPTA